MKRIMIALCLALIVGTGYSQVTVKQDKHGNYEQIQAAADTAGTKTGKTYTDKKGQVYPVYVNATGRLFVIRHSKTGNVYKQYLKLEN